MNPNVDMDALYKLSPDTVTTDLHNQFKDIMSFFNQPIKEDTFKAYVRRAMSQGYGFKAISRAIRRLPDMFEKFPSYTQFISVMAVEGEAPKIDETVNDKRWIDEVKPLVLSFLEKFGEEKVKIITKAYLFNTYGLRIHQLPPGLESYSSALAIYEFSKAGYPQDLNYFWEYCKRSVDQSVAESKKEYDAKIDRIRESFLKSRTV
jgi:hypothetical protein